MSLREFITQHRSLCEVEDVYRWVDPSLEVSALIHARLQCPSPPVLIFHNPGECDVPLAANLFATKERLHRVLCRDGVSLTQRLKDVPSRITSWSDFAGFIKHEYSSWDSSAVHRTGVAYQEVDSLYALPQIRYWSGDSRAYFSLPSVFTRALDSGEVNIGIYRLSPVKPKAMILNWRRGTMAYATWCSYATKGMKMPVTVCMGVDPAFSFASMFPFPGHGAELSFWNFIRASSPLCRNDEGFPLPADAEVVIEGYVDPYQTLEEGSFANHTGFYTRSVPCPVMHVTSIRMREKAVIPITLVGPPPTENGLVGAVIWDLLSVYIRRKLPHILRIMCPAETAYLPVLILQVEEARNHNEWAERKNTILSDSDLKRAHTLVLVDDNTDVTNFMSLYWHCMNMGQDSFSISDSGIRVVDGVLWKYQGKRKVRTP